MTGGFLVLKFSSSVADKKWSQPKSWENGVGRQKLFYQYTTHIYLNFSKSFDIHVNNHLSRKKFYSYPLSSKNDQIQKIHHWFGQEKKPKNCYNFL